MSINMIYIVLNFRYVKIIFYITQETNEDENCKSGEV